VAACIAATLVTFVQTKLLIRFQALTPDLSRLNPFRFIGLEVFLGRLVRACFELLLAVGLGVAFLAFLGPELLKLFNNDLGFFMLWPARILNYVVPFLLVCLAGGILCAILIKRFLFLRAHKMTRAELEREEVGQKEV
jgi:flagellar biosynthesis protein FlhB